jgi:uncharacterized membrane protein
VAGRRSRQVARADQRTAQITQQAAFTSVTRSGPLPTPDELERYEAIVPGMAERLVAKFEQQADHRMSLESDVIHADIRRGNWGLIAAFIFGLIVLVASVVLILNGHEGAGTTGIIVEFLTFGGAFLYGSETRRRERNRKVGR